MHCLLDFYHLRLRLTAHWNDGAIHVVLEIYLAAFVDKPCLF